MVWYETDRRTSSGGVQFEGVAELGKAGAFKRVDGAGGLLVGVLLIWIGLALGCRSVLAGLVTVVYVIPAYVVYLRSEEQMMSAHFGEEYRRYCAEVGGLWPRRPHSSR